MRNYISKGIHWWQTFCKAQSHAFNHRSLKLLCVRPWEQKSDKNRKVHNPVGRDERRVSCKENQTKPKYTNYRLSTWINDHRKNTVVQQLPRWREHYQPQEASQVSPPNYQNNGSIYTLLPGNIVAILSLPCQCLILSLL